MKDNKEEEDYEDDKGKGKRKKKKKRAPGLWIRWFTLWEAGVR